nr:MAG TPA: hypothetical protein [Caudoviricetes sp.]
MWPARLSLAMSGATGHGKKGGLTVIVLSPRKRSTRRQPPE